MEKNSIFREKSIEQISSPEQLNEYVKLTNPGVWFILAAISVILAGACIFGIFGSIDSTVRGVGISKNGRMVCLVKKEYAVKLKPEMKAKIDGGEHKAIMRTDEPATVWNTTEPYALQVGDLQPGEWVYEIDVEGEFTDGTYEVTLVTDRISPLSFLLGKNEEK